MAPRTEVGRKISAALTGRKLTPEHVAAIKAGITPEARARSLVGLAGGRGPKSAETRAKIGAANAIAKKGSRLTPEHRARIGAGLKGHPTTDEARQKISASAMGNTRVHDAPVKGECAYCGDPGTEWDHVIPRGRLGWDAPDNTVPCCMRCNRSKRGRTPGEWLAAGLVRD